MQSERFWYQMGVLTKLNNIDNNLKVQDVHKK